MSAAKAILTLAFSVAFFSIPVVSHAQGGDRNALAYINGIFTSEETYLGTEILLQGQYRLRKGWSLEEFNSHVLAVSLYNPSGCPEDGEPGTFEWQKVGCALDLFEAGVQSGAIQTARAFWELEDELVKAAPPVELAEDLAQAMTDAAIFASQLVTAEHTEEMAAEITQALNLVPGRLALVAHSQGNYFASDVFHYLDNQVSSRIGIISAASPSDDIPANSAHVMAGCDVIRRINSSFPVNAPSAACLGLFPTPCEIKCHLMRSYIVGALTNGLARTLLLRSIDEVWGIAPTGVTPSVTSVEIDQASGGEFHVVGRTECGGEGLAEALEIGAPVRLRIFGEGLDLLPLQVAFDGCSELAVAPASAFYLWREAECIPVGSPGERHVTIGDGSSGEVLCEFSIGVFSNEPPEPKIPVPTDDDLPVNSITAGGQNAPDVAALPNGGYVAVWAGPSVEEPGSSAIFARLFDADAVALTNDFRVSGFPIPSVGDGRPAVAADDRGNFIVAWEHSTLSGDIKGRWYDSSGAPPVVVNIVVA